MIRSKKLRNSARNEDCQIRIPGICNFNHETTVLAHVGSNSGMGMKPDDTEASFCCSACHDAIDGRMNTNYSPLELKLMAKEGAERTRAIWLERGLMKIA